MEDDAGPLRPQWFHTASLGLLFIVPTVVFTVLSLLFAFCYHPAPAIPWVVFGIFLGFSLLLMFVRNHGKRPRYWFNLGCLCFIAAAVATACGLVNWQRNFSKFWAYKGQREYNDVAPSSPAVAHLDAGKILFTADAHLDISQSLAYQDGRRYCVAPIVGSGGTQSQIEYWAAGAGCCEPGVSFTCDEAEVKQAHGGLVYLSDRDTERFKKAVEQGVAVKAGGLASSEDALFVRWVQDPSQAQRAYWGVGIGFLVSGICIHMAFSLAAACMLHFRSAPAKSKLEARTL